MFVLLALGWISFAICLMLTPVCRDLALRYNIAVDRPDEVRKRHGRPTPRLGGIPIAIAYVAALAIVYLMAPAGQKLYIQHQALLWSLLPATAIVFVTGLVDDVFTLTPWAKLAGQLVAASVAVGLGTHFTTTNSRFFAHHPALATPWLVYPISFLWLIGCTNAVNLIDGLDGLAAGVGLFATVTALVVGIFTSNAGLVLATLPLVGALLAFLCFNFSPASIFLGDCGSLTIGFALGCFALIWSQRGGSMMGLVGPLIALALPLIDVGLAISRRYLRSEPITRGDRGHIHHMVLARGHKPRTATLILYGVCAVAGSLALTLSFSPSFVRSFVIALFLLLVLAGVNYLNYTELTAARRAVSRKEVRRQVREEIYLQELERLVESADSLESCWIVVCKVCAEMHFDSFEMMLQESHFTHGGASAEGSMLRMTLPLGDRGYLKLRRESSDNPKLMMPAIERLQDKLTRKAFSLANEPYIVQRAGRSPVGDNKGHTGAA